MAKPTKPFLTPRRLSLLLFVAVLLLAFFLRLRGLETTGLWGDQAFTLNTAMRWVNGGPMPLAANKSSVGFVNPPMIEYLYAAALRLWPDILSVSWLTLLGGLAAVAVTGYVAARLFGQRAGLWSVLAFAVAPWAVFWSQLIWNQTMVPPFAALALGGLLLYIAGRPRLAYLLVTAAAAAVMTQVHPGSAVQLITVALVLLIFRRRVVWRHVLIAALLFAALYIPYLIYQVGTGWADIRAMGAIAEEPAGFSPAAVLLSLDLIRAQGLYRAVARTTVFDTLATWLFVLSLILVVGRGIVAERARRQTAMPETAAVKGHPSIRPTVESAAVLIILLWLVMPVLFYLRSSVYLQNYYLVGQWPAQFLILGIGLDTAQRLAEGQARRSGTHGVQRIWSAFVWFLPLPFLALFAFQVAFSLQYQDARLAGDGPPLQVRHARAAIAQSRALLAEQPDCLLVAVGQGHQVENSNLALLQEFVAPGRVLLADGQLALPLPSPCAVYLDGLPDSPASNWLAANAAPIDDAGVLIRDRLWPFYRWTDETAAAETAIARWTNGATLLSFQRGEISPDADLPLTLTWHVDGSPNGRSYHFGTYLLTPDSQVITQRDGPGFDSVQWRPGDRFITWFTLPVPADIPPGAYDIAAALYSWPDQIRTDLIDGGNTAYLERIELNVP